MSKITTTIIIITTKTTTIIIIIIITIIIIIKILMKMIMMIIIIICIFVDLTDFVKRSVLPLVHEIRRYGTDHWSASCLIVIRTY